MAERPARAARAVLYGVLVGALVAGVASGGFVAEPGGFDAPFAGFGADERPPATIDERSAISVVDGSPAGRERLVTVAGAGQDDPNDGDGSDGGGGSDGGDESDGGDGGNGGDGNESDAEMLGEFDAVKTTFDVGENGSATVTVVYRYRIEGNESAVEWERLRADIAERRDRYLEAEHGRWRETIRAARNETDRGMNVSSFAVELSERTTPRELGEVTFTFRWSGFGAVELNRIDVGDAIDGYVLDADTELWIAWPADYELQSVEPAPDEPRDSRPIVGWRGTDTDFVDGEPRVTVLREGEARAGRTPVGDDGLPLALAFGGTLLFVLGAVAAWWFVRTDGWQVRSPGERDDDSAVGGSPPAELLSNEERVLALLTENGGRMRQQAVVAELDWTEAKTSQVVGRLREADEIEVFRVGRENVLALPGERDEPRREA